MSDALLFQTFLQIPLVRAYLFLFGCLAICGIGKCADEYLARRRRRK